MPRSLALLLTSAVLGLVHPSVAEEATSFIGVGERRHGFQQAPERPACDAISYNLKFCAHDTDWQLETQPIRNGVALYSLSRTERAALKVVFMARKTSLDLSGQQIEALLLEAVFNDGPRGEMKTLHVIADDMSNFNKRILSRHAVVTDPAGRPYLLKVSIQLLDYGVGFLQSTLAIPDPSMADDFLWASNALHQQVLDKTRISVSLRPR